MGRAGTSLKEYVEKRKKEDPDFGEGYAEGLAEFKLEVLGQMLKDARKAAKMTQTEVADQMGTKKSVISRIEKQGDDIRVSTLFKFANAVGKEVAIR